MSKQVFVRDATGLVRELSFWDQFLIVSAIIVVLDAFVATQIFAPFYFPGANLIIVIIIGALMAVPVAYVYGKAAGAIARSGADYVWSTRIMGPLYGSVQFVFILATTITGIVFVIWSQFAFAISPTVFAVGVSTNNLSLANFGISLGSPGFGYPGSMILLVVDLIISILSVRVFRTVFRVFVPIFFAINIFFILMLLSINPSTLAPLFDHAMKFSGYNITYTGLTQQAAAAGYAPSSVGFNWQNTLLCALPWGFLPYGGFQYASYLAGETKNAKTSIIRAMMLSILVTATLLVIMAVLTYQDLGSQFIYSASYIAAVNPGAMPVLPFETFIIGLMNPVIAVVFGFGLFIGSMVNAIGYIITMSRMTFAASFDSMVPRRFADVSERWHSPYFAVLLVGVFSGLWMTVYWNYGPYASLLNTSILLPIAYAMPLLAIALLPYIKPSLYERIFGSMRGASILSIAGLLGVAGFIVYAFAETFPISSGTFLGTSLQLAYEVVALMIVIGVLLYVDGRFRLKRLGVPMKGLFAEIPPE
jgi:amino acid transporter